MRSTRKRTSGFGPHFQLEGMAIVVAIAIAMAVWLPKISEHGATSGRHECALAIDKKVLAPTEEIACPLTGKTLDLSHTIGSGPPSQVRCPNPVDHGLAPESDRLVFEPGDESAVTRNPAPMSRVKMFGAAAGTAIGLALAGLVALTLLNR